MIQKKQKMYSCFILLSTLLISNCGTVVKTNANPDPSLITSATQSTGKSSPTEAKTPTSTPLPTLTFTPSPVPIVLPAVTISSQEAEAALQELLKTNGNCAGKCLAGIRPDEMTVQEAVNQIARWGMLRMSVDKEGRIFITNVYLDPSSKQVNLNLAITLRKKSETTYHVSFYVPRREDGDFVDAGVWLANREAWQAFQFDNLLKAYGTPSFVGFRLDTWDREGKFIVYTLYVVYKQMNLEIGIGGLAQSNGQGVFICPSKDPHNLGIDINPEVSGAPLENIQQISPITWQELTGSDLQSFYRAFTDESNSNGCVITTLEKIKELDPYFQNVGFPPS